jgi:ATP-binding cassette subfamily B protein
LTVTASSPKAVSDETADVVFRSLIASRLPSIMDHRTRIIVAHRLSTARQARRIMVMRNGRIVEDGDHQTLIDAGGIYVDMSALDNFGAIGNIP